jgi:hypothetical protein
MKLNILILLVLLLAFHQGAYAMDPMRIRIRTNLPKEIKTVGRAAQYYAATVGYQLTVIPPAPSESRQIADEPLSPLTRTDRVLPVSEAILILLKKDFLLVVDVKNKLFSFQRVGMGKCGK